MSAAFRQIGKGVADLDPFTRTRFSDISQRFLDAKRAHQRAERRLWLGTIAAEFADDELAVLKDMGYLCQNDEDLMRAASRPVGSWPPAEPSEAEAGQ